MMPYNTPMTKERAESVFRNESMLIGSYDGILLSRAIDIVGKDAANYGCGEPGSDYNYYGITISGRKQEQVKYLYKKGFLKAVTYRNLEITIADSDNKKMATPTDESKDCQ